MSSNGRPPLVPFTIAKAAHPAALPRPAATIAAIEFGFRGPGTLHRGDLVRFANHGFLVHMIVFATAAATGRPARSPGSSRGQAAQGPAPLHRGGTFAGPISHGAYQQLISAAPRLVRAGLLHGNPGRPRPHPLGMERVIHVR